MESFEIYESTSRSRSISWFEQKVDSFTTSSITGVSMRGVIDGHMTNMAFEKVEDEHMEEVLDQLIEQGHILTTKEKEAIRKPETFESVHKDIVWKRPSVNRIKEVLADLEKKLLAYDPRIVQVNEMGFEDVSGNRKIVNSYGLDVQDEDTYQYMYAYVAAKENDDIQVNFEVEMVYDLDAFDLEAFVEKVCANALKKLNARSVKSAMYPVILQSDAASQLFGSFVNLMNGELLYKQISCLHDKLGEKIFSDKITIVDDPRNLNALTIANFDDEGCPTRRKILVDKGVFVQALHSTKSASRMNTESTGNGFKSGYASTVGVQPMNCCIEPGDKDLDTLIQEMKEGIVIEEFQGLHAGINFVSTNFSLQASGYTVKDGKRDKSIHLITMAANFMELMNEVVDVANDLEWKQHSIKSPSIRFKECSISGE